MSDLSGIIKQLVTERDRLNAAIAALEGVSDGASRNTTKRTTFSAAHRAKLVAAQRARWAKVKRKKGK